MDSKHKMPEAIAGVAKLAARRFEAYVYPCGFSGAKVTVGVFGSRTEAASAAASRAEEYARDR